MNALKKIGNFILILLGIALILICADLLTNKTINKSYDDLSDPDRKAIGEICKIVDLFDKSTGNEDIWNDVYNPSDTGFAVIRSYGMVRGYCYVINADLPASMFAQKIDMSDEYDDINVYRFALCTPSLLNTFNSSFDDDYITVNNTEITAVKYDKNTVNISGAGSIEEKFVVNTFHDALDTPDAPTASADIHFVMNAENIAFTGLQYRIIDELLATDDKELAGELLCEYVLVRDYQASRYPAFEKQQEKIELVRGCEQYVWYNVGSKTGDGYTYFDKKSSDKLTFYSAYYYLCTGNYGSDVEGYFTEEGSIYTGAALCEIMNKFDMIPNWQEKLNNSTNTSFVSQYSLIKNYCKFNHGKNAKLEDIQRSYNYEEILSMAKTLMKGSGSDKSAN